MNFQNEQINNNFFNIDTILNSCRTDCTISDRHLGSCDAEFNRDDNIESIKQSSDSLLPAVIFRFKFT